MDIRILFYHNFRGKGRFELRAGSRPFHILMLVSDGSFSCTMNGTAFVAGPGEAVCFPQNTYFEREIIAPLSIHQIGFFVSADDPCAQMLPAGKLDISRERVCEAIAALDCAACGRLHDSVALRIHMVSHLMMENFIACRHVDECVPSADDDVARAVRYLADHMDEKISMEELAARLHLSYTGFLFKFRNTMQCTPLEYLIRIRMQRAKQLLLEGNLRINEIARLCGYSNAYYFSNAFRKCFRMSPGAYRSSVTMDVHE